MRSGAAIAEGPAIPLNVLGSREAPDACEQTAPRPHRSIIAGHHRGRRAAAAALAAAGWEIETTSDLAHALHRMRETQPEAALIELRLALGRHHGGLDRVPALAPRTMLVTFGRPPRPVRRDELGAVGIWGHLDGPVDLLHMGLAVDRLYERFLEALQGEDAIVPQHPVTGWPASPDPGAGRLPLLW